MTNKNEMPDEITITKIRGTNDYFGDVSPLAEGTIYTRAQPKPPVIIEDFNLTVDPSVPSEMILFPDNNAKSWFLERLQENDDLDAACHQKSLEIIELKKSMVQPPVIEGLQEALKLSHDIDNPIVKAARLYAQGLIAPPSGNQLDPDMPADELRLHMGELTGNEVLVARSAIRWANSQNAQPSRTSPLLYRFTDTGGHKMVAVAEWYYDEIVNLLPDVKTPTGQREG